MINGLKLITRFLKSTFFLGLITFNNSVFAVNFYAVTSASDSGAGSLRAAITSVNSSGTGSSAANNVIIISSSLGSTITLASNLPVLQNGATICVGNTATNTCNSGSALQTISGANNFRIFATYKSSVILNNIALTNGLALGGNGGNAGNGNNASAGGGGLGAGGGIYLGSDANTPISLTLVNSSVQNCLAQGGIGGSVTGSSEIPGGGGGGASWNKSTTYSKNAPGSGSALGGGDYPGNYSSSNGGLASIGVNGYGGGAGGSAAGFSGGSGGGNGTGTTPSGGTIFEGGAGGYCGGGGGTSANVGGGGGGNGGGNGPISGPGTSGGGGGYGSGGGGGIFGGSAGGGGLGGGGGGGATPGGGGGGGFGGGGGGTSGSGDSSSAPSGGFYGGTGGAGPTGGGGGGPGGAGGGGAGIGGGIFAGDSVSITLGNSVTISGNTTNFGVGGTSPAGGSANGTQGSTLANNLFLFQNASLTFNGNIDFPVTFDIQGDPLATSNPDLGVTISTTGGATVTYSGTNTYQGNTTISNSGILSSPGSSMPGSNITTPGNLIVQASGTFNLTSGNFPTNTLINNAATAITNIAGTLAPLTNSINAGTMNINSGGSFITPATFTFSGTFNVNTGGVPISNTLTGNPGSTINFGQTNSVNITATPTMNNVASIFVKTNGTNLAVTNSISGLSTTLSLAASTTTTLNAAVSGAAATTNSGNLIITVNNGLNTTGNMTNNASGNIFSAGTFTPATYNTFTNNGGVYIYGSSGSISGAFNSGIGSNGSLSFGKDAENTLYNNTYTLNGAISNTPTLHVYAGTLNTNAKSISGVTTELTVDPNATLNISGTYDGGPITNNGALIISNSINISGSPLNSTGNSSSVTIRGQRTLTTTTYTNSNAHNSTITDIATFDQLTVTGAVNLAGSTLTITAEPNAADTHHSWLILSASPGQLTGPSNLILPTVGGLFSDWSSTVTNTSITINLSIAPFPDLASGTVNEEIAAVIQQMANNITNSEQQILIDALYAATTQAGLNDDFQQLRPATNANSPNVTMQNTIFTRIQTRIASLNSKFNNSLGISTGDVNPSTALWVTGFGSFGRQTAIGVNPGYRAKGFGAMIGLDTTMRNDKIFGLGFALSKNIVYEYVNPGVTTSTIGYHFLTYCTHLISHSCHFVEWLGTAAITNNSGSRLVNINGVVMSTTSQYRGAQGAVRVNYGSDYNLLDTYTFTPLLTGQYAAIYMPNYHETSSPAALYVQPTNYQNVLTFGGGARLSMICDEWWMVGVQQLRALVTYDAISSKNNVVSSFIVGSSAFGILNPPSSRLAFETGIDFIFTIVSQLNLELSFDYEVRKDYTNYSGNCKLKYLL